MAEVQILTIGSTNLVELTELLDRATKTYPSTAVVTCDLLDANNTAVEGAAGISMTHVTGTAGKATTYRGVIPHTVTLTSAAAYTARITATYAGVVRRFEVACVAMAVA